MKYKFLYIFVFFSLVTGNILWAEHQTSHYPSAWLKDVAFEFSPVVDGRKVIHDFIIQNKGTAPLEIQNVKTD